MTCKEEKIQQQLAITYSYLAREAQQALVIRGAQKLLLEEEFKREIA
jgi:hypothetical protein